MLQLRPALNQWARRGKYTAPSGSDSLMLDDYPGADTAWANFKLRDAYTGSCMRIRRSSDNAQTDIGFDGNGDIDNAAILAFVGAGDGFVVIRYDQSGNGIDWNVTTEGYQPQIVNAGTLITDEHGRAAPDFTGVRGVQTLAPTAGSVTSMTYLLVFKFNGTPTNPDQALVVDYNSGRALQRNGNQVRTGLSQGDLNVSYSAPNTENTSFLFSCGPSHTEIRARSQLISTATATGTGGAITGLSNYEDSIASANFAGTKSACIIWPNQENYRFDFETLHAYTL